MPLTIDTVPSDCLNGAGDCLLIGFTTDALVEATGNLNPVLISQADAGDFQLGTTIAINSAIFTLAGASNPAANQVQYSGTPAIMLTNLETVLSTNYYIQKNYTIQIVGSELQLTPKLAILQTDLIFDNLSGASTTRETSFLADPVQTRPGYSAKVCLTDADTNFVLGEVRIYAIPKANDDFTDIASYRLDKDVAAVIQKSLSCPLPSLETVNEPTVFDASGLARRVTFTAAEAYGAPLNHYQQLTNPTPFAVLNGGVRRGEDLTDLCGGLLKLEEDKINLFCKQPFWLYRYTGGGTALDIYEHNVEFFDIAGTSLGSRNIDVQNAANIKVMAFESGFSQMTGSMGVLGVDPADVHTYTVTIVHTLSGIPQSSDSVTFTVIGHSEAETLIFKTSLGTFTSLYLNPLNSVTMNGAQEFIQLCTPCGASVSDRGSHSVRVNDTFDLSFSLYNIEEYDCRMVEELFASEEVYWMRDGLMYHIQPNNEDVLVFQRRTNINPVFNAKLYY